MSKSYPLRIIAKVQPPYGGEYLWTDPMVPGSKPLSGGTWEILLNKARAQRYANSVPVGLEFEDELEAALCRDYPHQCFRDDPTRVYSRRLSLGEVLTGTQVMLKHRADGSPLVSQAEANTRASICKACDLNITFAKPCKGCPDLEGLAQKVTGSLATPYDENLRSCSICGCYTKVAVWIPLKYQLPVLTDFQKEQFQNVAQSMAVAGKVPCWKAINEAQGV